MTVKVAFDGAAHDPGPPPVPPAADTKTAVVTDEDIARFPPKKSSTSGVRNRNGWRTVTVSVLPDPAPPGAALQAMVDPAWFRQVVAIGSSGPSPCVWAFFSWTARACMPTVSVGWAAPYAAASRAALLTWM